MYEIKTENFEGPLDLLLRLIEDAKLDITKISLAKITNSYLEEIAKMDCSGEDMAEFVVIASKLLYLKSRELLPQDESEEEEAEIADLEARLIEYQKYKEAAKRFEEILAEGNRSYKRRAKSERIISFAPPKEVGPQQLYFIFEEVLKKIETETKEEKTLETVTVTIEEKRNFVRSAIKGKKKISFREVLGKSKSKVDCIVTFLAILEMIKQGEISVKQEKNFADFTIEGLK